MILEDIKSLKTTPRDLRKFGLLVGGVFTVVGLLWFLRHKPYYPWLLTPGLILIAFGTVLPKILKPVYIAWMSFAIVLGFVVSHVLLTGFFFLVVTPIGLLARLWGKDFLRLKLDRSASTYWLPRPPPLKDTPRYDRQF